MLIIFRREEMVPGEGVPPCRIRVSSALLREEMGVFGPPAARLPGVGGAPLCPCRIRLRSAVDMADRGPVGKGGLAAAVGGAAALLLPFLLEVEEEEGAAGAGAACPIALGAAAACLVGLPISFWLLGGLPRTGAGFWGSGWEGGVGEWVWCGGGLHALERISFGSIRVGEHVYA